MAQETPRVGQISITVNGECLAGGGFRQHLFELSGGPATDAPFPYSQRPDVVGVYEAAIRWMIDRAREVGVSIVDAEVTSSVDMVGAEVTKHDARHHDD